MQIVDCEQGTEEWFQARLGVITASRFKDVLTQPRSAKAKEDGTLSETAYTYLCELLGEKWMQDSKEINAKALDWGREEEPKALEDYAFTSPEPITQVGLVLSDCGRYGGSPDALVGDSGGLEIKCPHNRAIHVKTLLKAEVPAEHIPQVQGNLWICERDWWDFMSFRNELDPALARVVIRVYRDEAYIRDLALKVGRFADLLEEKYNQYTPR